MKLKNVSGYSLAVLFLFGLFASTVLAAGSQQLKGHRTADMAAAPLVGEISSSQHFNLAIGLPLRNADELQTFITQVSDPKSPLYRHYMTTDQFTQAYGPSEQDYQEIVSYLKAKGLNVTNVHNNRMIVDVSASNDDIEKAFHVKLHNYQRPDGTTFYGPDSEPTLDTDTPVLHISGLDNYVLPHPKMVIMPIPQNKIVTKSSVFSKAVTNYSGSGPDGLYRGTDFRNAYAPSVSLNGSGQSVALFELDTYYPGDVSYYFSQAGLTPPPINNIYLDGWSSTTTPGGGNGEVSLDIDQAGCMAPGLNQINVYMGPNIDDVLNRIATDNSCKQISSSWGWGPSNSTELQIESQYAAQGQSYFTASGDSGAFTADPGGNDDDPTQTLVGGTNLNMNGNGASYASESGWAGTVGGIMTNVPIPTYQQGINMSTNGGSTTYRNCPDVASVASNCVLYANNSTGLIGVGGTSVAAPTWAGFMALVNQQATQAGLPTVGFANPALYTIGKGANYTSDFHDVTTGNNGGSNNSTGFNCVTGFDLVTGWGSPNGQNLINALSQAAGAPTATATGTPTPVVASSWRVHAGGAAYTDSQSHVWAADENYGGGSTNSSTAAITGALPASTDQALYQFERYENPTLTYTFNVPAGSYQVTLKFAELFDNGSGERIMNVSINGTQVLTNFDIFATAGGLDIAKDEVFSNIAPSNGKIVIQFSAAAGSPDGNAKVDALQIVPQPLTPTNTPTKTNTPTNTLSPTNTPIPPTATNTFTFTSTFTFTPTATPVVKSTWRIAGGKTASYTDCQTNVWSPDSNYNTGAFNSNTNAITKALPCTTDQSLYQSEHWGGGSFTYTFNVPAGSYQTTLKFAEIFDAAAGQRIQNVTINGTQVLTNFDIFADAGGQNIADDKVFNNIAPVNGQIVITFATTASSPDQNAKMSAIQIIAQPATPTNTMTSTAISTATATRTNTATNTFSSTPSFTPTATNTNSSTSTFTSTATRTNSPTASFTPTATSTNSSTASFTPTATSTNSSTASFTPTATNSNTYTSTSTPTATNTGTTVVQPTSTSSNTATVTSTFSSTATPTLTSTNTFSSTPTSTATATNSATSTNSNTATSTFSFTATATLTNTNTFSSTPTSTSTLTNSPTATSTLTNTSTFTKTNTPVPPTATFTLTNSSTATSTSTNTATKTLTNTPTFTWTFTPVPPTATFTKTNTPVPPTATFTKTNTPVPPTATPTLVPPTATPTSGGNCAGVPVWNGNFVAYATGALVTYDNELYQCIQGHTSEPNWMPPVVPALWKDMGPCSNFVASTTTIIKSAVAGPNISRNSQPVRFFIQLNSPAQITVDIYTLMGQMVASTSFYGNSGFNSWLWDIQNASKQVVTSGLYIYTLTVSSNGNKETKTGKIVIMH